MWAAELLRGERGAAGPGEWVKDHRLFGRVVAVASVAPREHVIERPLCVRVALRTDGRPLSK
jgi:hypothetical protein